jgi:hypothetical protein
VSEDYEIEIDAAELQISTDRELSGEVVRPGRMVTLAGQDFRVADKVGLMPLLKFSHAADLRTDDPQAYVAMYEILRDVIYEGDGPCGECPACVSAGDAATARECAVADEGDWGRFQEHATHCKADADELFDVVAQAVKLISARPTESPSGSSAGRRSTSRNSTAISSRKQGAAPNGSRRGRRAT